jgi:hypothetical protein
MKAKKVILAILVLGLALCFSTFVAAQENEAVRGEAAPYDSPDAGLAAVGKIIPIPASAFTNDGVDPDGFFISFAGGYLEGLVDFGCCNTAPVIFPEGATSINWLKIVVWDNNASASEFFDFYRMDLLTGTSTLLGGFTTSDSAGPVVYTINPNPNTLSSRYAYYVGTCVRTSIYVYGMAAGYN